MGRMTRYAATKRMREAALAQTVERDGEMVRLFTTPQSRTYAECQAQFGENLITTDPARTYLVGAAMTEATPYMVVDLSGEMRFIGWEQR